MLEFNARDFYHTTTLIQHTLTALQGNENVNGPVDATFKKMMIERCGELEKSLVVLGAPITQMAAAV